MPDIDLSDDAVFLVEWRKLTADQKDALGLLPRIACEARYKKLLRTQHTRTTAPTAAEIASLNDDPQTSTEPPTDEIPPYDGYEVMPPDILPYELLDETPQPPKGNGSHAPKHIAKRKPSKAITIEPDWKSFGYAVTDRGAPLNTLANAQKALESDPNLAGHIWYDEFLDAIMTDWGGKPRQWEDAHDVGLCGYMQLHLGLTRLSIWDAHNAALLVAKKNPKNECKDWIESLEWDGTERLPYLLSDGFGAPHNAYTQAVGRCWMVSIVARVIQPGCKVDTVPVLEGDQGTFKSSALSVLGGKWFVEAHESVMSKDFFGVLNGHMIVEISEMHSFTRAEVERIKGVISCQVDRYRKAYGRNTEDHPRHTVLVCTTNRDDWQRDDTGARRFWPVRCGLVTLDWLKTNREQLFAEAKTRYLRGEKWWDVPETEQRQEVDDRREIDSWEHPILEYLASREYVTIGQILGECLSVEISKQDQMLQRRVARILRVSGWITKPIRNSNGLVKRAWGKK